MSDQLSAALQYWSLGWQPVAAPQGGKSPVRSWKRAQSERIPEREVREAFARPANVFLVTGSVSRLLVLDCDDGPSLVHWRDRVGDLLDRTTAVKTRNGFHFYFRLPVGARVRNRSVADGTGKWDVRAEGGGVIAPPSVHESGHIYEWVRGPKLLVDCPAELLETESATGSGGGETRSILTHLLQNPATEGDRNNWLTRVAGHYAKHIPHQDAYEHLVRESALKVPGLDEEEVDKLVESVWRAEQAKQGRAVVDLEEGGADQWRSELLRPSDETGWLASGDTRILIQVREKVDDGYVYGLSSWLDCDIRVLGIVEGDEDQIYSVELRFSDGTLVEDHLPAKTIADSRTLAGWLAAHGASIGTPDNLWPVRMRESTRLLRYLRSQGANPMVAAEALGWHTESGSFITHEGVIQSDGPKPFANVRPDPSIKGWAPYRYGHAGRDEAQRLLAEVLTFHDETVASVFGSWWAATFLKPQIQARASQFPFIALEASSESGKTTGFFQLMLQLSGYHGGQTNPTRAALRDYLSAHNNGIVWVDDLDDLDALGELLRNVTVGGSLVKKGAENHAQVVARLRGALVVSGESLGLRDQKALVDRAVLLDVPSPTGRRSQHGDYPQWDDIVRLKTDHPDLTEYAGSLVELALEQEAVVNDLKALRKGSGRHADALAILRVGARVLYRILGGRELGVIERVDSWVTDDDSTYSGRENLLTLKLVPLALEATGWLRRPEGPDPAHRRLATPAFVDEDGIVWFSPTLLAEWWVREPRASKKINARVESGQALEQQAREMGLGGKKGVGRKDFKFVTGEGTKRYWRCDQVLSELLLRRSRGIKEDEADVVEDRQLQ